jgi:hypothetical protein
MWIDSVSTRPFCFALLAIVSSGICMPERGFAQTSPAAASSRSVVIDAVDSAGNATTLQSWRNVYGSSAKTKAETRQLDIAVRNLSGTLPGEFKVEWFFVGKPAAGTRRFLYDKGSRQMSLKPGAFEKFEVESKQLNNYRYHSVSSGYVYRSGDRADGWIVRVKVGDDVVRTKASSPQLEELEKNKDEFERFLKNGRE